MRNKVSSYMGLAKKAGQLISGTNTCAFAMKKGKVRLIILAGDISENGEKKIMKEINRSGVKFVKYGKGDELSRAVGSEGRSVFAVCDENFAEVIFEEIDRQRREGGIAYEDKGTGSRA